MVLQHLKPSLELLREEYVLIQAWKKSASYIRYHNWYSDTLSLDYTSVNLPFFLGELRERLQDFDKWQNDPLRIVLAPKSQLWKVNKNGWEPVEKGLNSAPLRPLAHVNLAEQVVATALMLCLADRVETLQGDPRWSLSDWESRKRVISYGNRLFCDSLGNNLRHRWGSTKLYRAYYQDYRMFLARPEVVAESISEASKRDTYVVHADLSQFYDRVRPDLLHKAINRIHHENDDPEFFTFAESVLNWGWHPRDEGDCRIYTDQTQLDDFKRVALPQGLVASGFFANVVLLPFDQALREAIGSEIAHGIVLEDSCRYVDDLRLVIVIESDSAGSPEDYADSVTSWLRQVLEYNATGLKLSDTKTQIAALGGDERPLVRQREKMNRIQSAVSGGFDALGGEEILDAIQGLMRAQDALSLGDDSGWRFSPVPDVRDETVARFGAARYRATFRSIRPLFEDEDTQQDTKMATDGNTLPRGRPRISRTQQELDEDTRVFALGLIQRWINNPSNVRLLRIGLDLWPDVELLREVLSLLRPFTEKGGRRKAPRRVAWYCLAEILRAGATETGLVSDAESLPSAVELESYRQELCSEAIRLVALPARTIPWYLRQQALLFLAAFAPEAAPVTRTGSIPETLIHRELIRFLRGEGDRISRLRSSDFATLAVLTRHSFADRARAVELTRPYLSPSRKWQIALRAPAFLLELIDLETQVVLFDDLPARVREDLCRNTSGSSEGYVTLSEEVLSKHPTGSLRNELSLLCFTMQFLKQWRVLKSPPEVITPVQVQLGLIEEFEIAEIKELYILGSRTNPSGSLYAPPNWCKPSERWRFQLGFLLRFILSGQPDFTRFVRRTGWKETELAYRPVDSHWYQRLYGLYSGQPAFGDDWVPITDWVEGFLLALLRWPGCRAPAGFDWIDQGIDHVMNQIRIRIAELRKHRGNATHTLILPLVAKRPTATNAKRPLRACVVQTVIPTTEKFHRSDLPLDDPSTRKEHRYHLSTALAAVERMLALRETHKKSAGRLDWLILPELAVHPKDVRTHLIPFARAHRSIILTGLTYQEILAEQPLVNSALWVIPEWSDAYGLQIKTRRQGKAFLAPDEQALNEGRSDTVQGFRPCQWMVGYPWSNSDDDRPVWMTAAVCYDAPDLGLVADLRDESDILAIPALNKDVKTFDQMALALHYHMFQLVVVANNGQYGGSNAYWPRSESNIRQVFHTHGQPQASITFLEIDDIGTFLKRQVVTGTYAQDWKHPPAGLNAATLSDSM